MAVKDILLLGNPLLRVKSFKVDKIDEQIKNLITDLFDTLVDFQMHKGLGRAIAAPQVGVLKRVIFVNTEERSFALLNPVIIKRSEDKFKVWDSCFSFDAAFFILMERYREIDVKYMSKEGEITTEHFSEDMSELLQHEIDHLNGILATDHLKSNKDIIMREEWEKL